MSSIPNRPLSAACCAVIKKMRAVTIIPKTKLQPIIRQCLGFNDTRDTAANVIKQEAYWKASPFDAFASTDHDIEAAAHRQKSPNSSSALVTLLILPLRISDQMYRPRDSIPRAAGNSNTLGMTAQLDVQTHTKAMTATAADGIENDVARAWRILFMG